MSKASGGAAPEDSGWRPPLAEIGVTLAGVALLAGMVVAIPELRHAFAAAIHGDTAEVRAEVDSLGVAGPLLILALALIHTVVFYPAEIVDAAAGFVYGFFPALALVMVGWMISGFLCYAIGRSVARPLLDRWFGAERFERLEAMIDRGGATLLLAVRLIPIVPFSLALLRRRRRPRAALALRLDHGGRLPADHRARRLLRHAPGGPEPHRPADPGQRRGAAGAAARRPLDPAAPVAALSVTRGRPARP